jgi:flagellar transcriptional activator FlhD
LFLTEQTVPFFWFCDALRRIMLVPLRRPDEGKRRECMMNSTDTYNDIKEVNLAYLMLAQSLVRADREAAIFRLGISEEIADILDRLTPGQVLKMASTDMLLCSFRFDDTLLINLLANHERDRGIGHVHAAILAAGRAVETVA